MKAFVKNIGDYVIHNAPKGIRYWKIANGSNIENSVEVDLVPVEKGAEIPGHIHKKSNALALVVSGSGKVTLGDGGYNVRKGDIINIPAGVYHDFKASEDEELTFLSVQNPPINNDYVFSRRLPRRINIPNSLVPAIAAASLVLLNIFVPINENRKLRQENLDYRIVNEVNSNDYLKGIERGMINYHSQLEKIAKENNMNQSELISAGPYPAV